MDVTAGAHNERVRSFCSGKLESHGINTQGVIGTVAMNFIWLPIVAYRLPNLVMDGVNFNR
jgi:hypothetical protein